MSDNEETKSLNYALKSKENSKIIQLLIEKKAKIEMEDYFSVVGEENYKTIQKHVKLEIENIIKLKDKRYFSLLLTI